MQRDERYDRADRIITIGLWSNALLMLIKLAAGHYGNSSAVFADGVESGCDLVAAIMAVIALRIGRRPYDRDHPYGHGRAESISAIVVALIIFSTGIWILVDAVIILLRRDFSSPEPVAVIVALGTILSKELLHRITWKQGVLLQSPVVQAIAEDHRKDALTSIATLAGVAGAWLGFGMLDPIAAGLTSFLIMHIGITTFKSAAHDLMDGTVDPELLGRISAVAETVDHVEHVHEIRGRKSGQYLIVDLKLDMDPDLTVKQSHDAATEAKKRIFENFPNMGDVMIHINPHDEEHEDLIRL